MFDDLDNLFFVKLNNVVDKGMFEEKLSYKKGLFVCKNGYTNPLDSFIYCCDYSYEGKLCLEKKIILLYIITVLLTIQKALWINLEKE